jgi:hypothetical protein
VGDLKRGVQGSGGQSGGRLHVGEVWIEVKGGSCGRPTKRYQGNTRTPSSDHNTVERASVH